MNRDEKLRKLQDLRSLRVRLSLGGLALARHEEQSRQRDLEAAEETYEKTSEDARRNIKKALRDAEEIRDSAARFAGIAITMRTERETVDAAADDVEECIDLVSDAADLVVSTRHAHLFRSREQMKFEKLLDRVARDQTREAAQKEEDEIAELFRTDQKGH